MGRALRLSLVPLAALLAVGGTELFLSVRGWRQRPPAPAFERLARERLAGVTEFAYHPTRFYTLAPEHRAGRAHLGRYATGAWPFRGRPFEPAPAGMLRVAVVGDSAMYGYGLATSASVPERIAAHLAELGYGPDVCQVANFGVSGYTTVQVRLCVEQVLAEHAPDVVVLGAGGWNDQGPSIGVNDVEMLIREPAAWERWLPALANLIGNRTNQTIALPEVSPEELNAAWERGEPLFGTKVPAEQVQVAVAQALASCARARTPALVVVPAHPAETLREHPRTRADRDSVRAAALAAGVPCVDAPALFEASGLAEGRLHLDFGHPTPEGNDLVARAVAQELAVLLPPAPARGSFAGSLRALDWQPRRASMLGDVWCEIQVEGLGASAEVVALVGGAPLIGLERLSSARLGGWVMANGEGQQDLILQSRGGCVVLPRAVELTRPWLEDLGGKPPRVRAHARAGDRVQLYWSDARRSEPDWWESGRVWLGGQPRTPLEGAICGADGSVVVELPGEAAGLGELWVQARIGPPDVGAWERVSVTSEPLRLGTR